MNIGDVVYYIKKNGCKWSVDFGLVSEIYHSSVYIDLYCLFDSRQIDGIPANEFITPTKFKKLPKGWSYDTELFKLTWDYNPELANKAKEFHINKPEEIKKAIEIGLLIPKENYDFCKFETDITKEGWRIVRKYESYHYNPLSLSLYSNEVYDNYETAKDVIDAHEKELKRQAALTDEEWSIEQIEHNLARLSIWQDEDTIQKYREFLLNQENIEDIETRIFGSDLQWKYWKNKKWVNIGK